MKKVYKVVTENRTSVMATGSFRKKYIIGTIVKAKKYTAGIMCFKTLREAKKWLMKRASRCYTIKVKAMGKEGKPFGFYVGDLEYVKNKSRFLSKIKAWEATFGLNERYAKFPTGTICYPAVEVLT